MNSIADDDPFDSIPFIAVPTTLQLSQAIHKWAIVMKIGPGNNTDAIISKRDRPATSAAELQFMLVFPNAALNAHTA